MFTGIQGVIDASKLRKRRGFVTHYPGSCLDRKSRRVHRRFISIGVVKKVKGRRRKRKDQCQLGGVYKVITSLSPVHPEVMQE